MQDAEYFALPALSKSQVKKFNPDNPTEFWRYCVFNPGAEKVEMTDSMAFGKLAHALVLTPDIVKTDFVVGLESMIGKTRNNKKWQEAQAQESRLIVSTSEDMHAERMADACRQHEVIRELLRDSKAEQPYTWTDESWGPCKAKLDIIKNTDEGLYCVDYKTTGKMDTGLRYINSLGFQYDVGFYNRAAKVKYGKSLAKFVFIFQSTSEGEENLIKIKTVSGPQLEACEIATDVAVQAILKRLARYRAGDAAAWLPNLQAEEWELSQWIDEDISKMQQEIQ